MKKNKITENIVPTTWDKIVTAIIIIIMIITLVESIKARLDLHNYIDYKTIGGSEECVEDTSLV